MDLNKWIAVGKVRGAPQIGENNGKRQASLTIIVNRRSQDANEQWVDVPMAVPVFAFDKKADLIEKYVVDGQELGLECFLQTWDGGNGQLAFGMVIQNVSFGFKPRKDPAQAAPAGGIGGPPA